MTKKEVFKYKLKLLKELSCESPKRVHISKSGNYYVYLNKNTIQKVVKYTPMNVCKSNINKLFTERTWTKNSGNVIIMNQKGSIYVNNNSRNGSGLLKLSIKSKYFQNNYVPGVFKLFSFNKKYEWLTNNRTLQNTRLAYQFSSLKEYKDFLGYNFISVSNFMDFYASNESIIIFSKLLNKESRKSIIYHTKDYDSRIILYDTIEIMGKLSIIREIPKATEKLTLLHDELVQELNKSKAVNYSEDKYHYDNYNKFFDLLKKEGLNFEILDCARSLFLKGCSNIHCLATYTNRMDNNIFISFIDNMNHTFEAQISTNPYSFDHSEHIALNLVQIKGYRNKDAPKDIVDKLNSSISTFNEFVKSSSLKPFIQIPNNSVLEEELVDLPF